MKIFLFNPETGFYLGEDFADETPMEPGVSVIPPDATTVAPPRPEPGKVAVFNVAEQRWELQQRHNRDLTDAHTGQCPPRVRAETDG